MPTPPPSPSATPKPILIPALQVGALAGCAGLVGGGVAAVLHSAPNVGIKATGSGLSCFALGSTYWATRTTMFQALKDPEDALPFTPTEKTYLSGASGALAGCGIGLLLRGPSNMIPGAIVWGLAGLGGQFMYNLADASHSQAVTEQTSGSQAKKARPGLTDRLFRSEWSPVKKLTDEEYRHMLDEKLLVVEADIAVTDDEIKELEEKLRQSKR